MGSDSSSSGKPQDKAEGSFSIEQSTDKTTVLSEEGETLRREIQRAREQEACLIIIRGKPQGNRFFLTQDEMIIGRDPTVEIPLADMSISRRHAQIKRQNKTVTVMDLGSSNGTYVNDRKITPNQPTVLSKEDMVKLGNFILKFLPAGELEILYWGNLGLAAHTDPLTRIYNKGYLLEALSAEFKRAKALHSDFSLVFMDLDHFKLINDTYGHDAGDFILKEVANLIRIHFLRAKDVFARYGGEEFVILMSNTNAASAYEISDKIRVGIESYPFIYEDKKIPLTASIGIAELRSDIESSQTLLKTADKALYMAKQNGRNRIVVSG